MSERRCGFERHLNDANFCSKTCYYCTGYQMDRCEYNKPKEEKEPVKMACEHCEHFRKFNDVVGECTRFPQWVGVLFDHYCGEFKEREE